MNLSFSHPKVLTTFFCESLRTCLKFAFHCNIKNQLVFYPQYHLINLGMHQDHNENMFARCHSSIFNPFFSPTSFPLLFKHAYHSSPFLFYFFPLFNELHSHNCVLEPWRDKEKKGNVILHVLLCVVPFVCLHSFI